VNLSLEENFRQTIVGFAPRRSRSPTATPAATRAGRRSTRLIAQGHAAQGAAEIETIVQAGLMHDIGKIGIRYEKLNKPGKLTPRGGRRCSAPTPAKGKRILEPIPFMREHHPGLLVPPRVVRRRGYPQGLMGENIPLLGRIVAVADTYDAMTSDRAYRKALPHDVAVAELERCSGAQFDPRVVKVFLHEIEQYRKQQIAAGLEVPR
jgi:HD-GYP domain-containing protein (c-di-GMP phosphodiesterase class II)